MAVIFADELNPKNLVEARNFRLKFDYSIRAYQYLDHFNITSPIEHKYLPLGLEFEDYDALKQFLYDKGIVYDEITVERSGYQEQITKKVTVINLSKIFGQEVELPLLILQHKYYSVNEIAEMLSFSRPTIYKIINEGKLKATRINKQLRIKHSDYIDYVAAEP